MVKSIPQLSQLPNIILITNHDSGNTASCYGSPYHTPNIDRLAEQGIRFDNNFCTAPQCSPSRGSILTGKMPHVNGLMGLTNKGWDLPETNLTIPKLLRKRGYSTHLIGLQHAHRDAKTLGYDTISPRLRDIAFTGNRISRRAKLFFKKMDKKKIQHPFYAKIGIFEPHRPFFTGRRYRPKLSEIIVPPYLPDTKEIRKSIRKFVGSLTVLDKSIGKIVRSLENTSFGNNTLIIYTVDHGWAMPRAKCTFYDPGIRTSLIIKWPDRLESAKIITEMTSGVDILPSIMDLIGLPLSIEEKKEMQGLSFSPLILKNLNKSYLPRDHVIFEMNYHNFGYNPMRGIRTKDWKYILNYKQLVGEEKVLFEIPYDYLNQPSGKSYIEHHPEWSTLRPKEELYYLPNDPYEQENLAEVPEHSDKKKELNGKLMNFLEETKDPMLRGTIQMPINKNILIF